ncbi:unnamed protein product [Withania somnifera]
MARGPNFLSVLFAISFLFSSSLFLNSEARPLNFVNTGGPSPRGEGQKYIDASTLGRVKNSGHSPGMNH